jgi:hypothetical protein
MSLFSQRTAEKMGPPQASMPLNWTCQFDVKRNNCSREKIACAPQLRRPLGTNHMKYCLAEIDADRV